MVVLPLPPLALDVLFTFNIALSMRGRDGGVQRRAAARLRRFPDRAAAGDLAAPGAQRRLDPRRAAARPRRAPAPPGHVIQAFGQFVIGGNFAVGVVVFAILTIINFVVVTKGAGRISEVSARFTLDAMPGKQMAIDADLNAGLITQDEARAAPRRGARRGRLLRLHGRCQQVRARRCHRRHPDPVHQHRRRPGHRHAEPRHGLQRCRARLHAADHRRRPGGADSGAAAVDRGRDHRDAHVARRRTWAASCASSCSAIREGLARRRRRCSASWD